MKFLQKYADNTRASSTVNKWRRKRFSEFLKLIENLPRPVTILDVGGTENFWVQMGFTSSTDAEITLLNSEDIATHYPNITFIKGDARNLSAFGDKSFDVVFSNSVIEHVGGPAERKKMADEIQRVGKKYFVQTPNYYFPMEPHFLFPCFQFLPEAIKIFLLKNFSLGWFEKCSNDKEAKEVIDSIQLLKKSELFNLFSGGKLLKEKIFLMTKSYIVTS